MLLKSAEYVEIDLNTGESNSYYSLGETNHGEVIDVDFIARKLELTFAEGNCLKALFGVAKHRQTKQTRHSGTNSTRDKKKLLHYAKEVNKNPLPNPKPLPHG